MIYRLSRQQTVPASLEKVWAYFATPQNLNEMTPPNMNFEILHGGDGPMFQGQLIQYRVQFMPFVKSKWLTEITHIKSRSYFVDEQRIGPYRLWHHEHIFETVKGGTQISDLVTYVLPFGLLGDLIHTVWIRSRLREIFDYRQEKVFQIFGL